MKQLLLFCCMIAVTVSSMAQRRKYGTGVVEGPPLEQPVYRQVTEMPQFQGDLNKWILDHLRYPVSAKENNCEGRVLIRFEVREDGTVHVLSVQKRSGCPELDNEAKRMITSMPLWRPAKLNGQPVDYTMTLPVIFRLRQ